MKKKMANQRKVAKEKMKDTKSRTADSCRTSKNQRGIGWRFYLFVDLIGSLESPPSN